MQLEAFYPELNNDGDDDDDYDGDSGGDDVMMAVLTMIAMAKASLNTTCLSYDRSML